MEYGKSLEDLMTELTADKLYQEPPKTVLEEEQEEISDEEVEKVFSPYSEEEEADENDTSNIKDVSGLPELIVGIIDIFAGTIAEAWTKTDDKTKYRLQVDEKEELIKAWKLYLKNSEEVKISPSTMLLLTTSIIYAPKLITAMNEHKVNKAKEQWLRQQAQAE